MLCRISFTVHIAVWGIKKQNICEGGSTELLTALNQLKFSFSVLITLPTVWQPPDNIHESNYLNKALVQKQSSASSLWTLACWHHCAVTVRQIVLYMDIPRYQP